MRKNLFIPVMRTQISINKLIKKLFSNMWIAVKPPFFKLCNNLYQFWKKKIKNTKQIA